MTPVSLDDLLLAHGFERLGAPATDAMPEAHEVGFFHPSLPHRLQVIGCAASTFTAANPWTTALPRAIVIGSDARADDWTPRLAALALPVYRSPWPAPLAVDRLRSWLREHTAPRQHVHATLVRVFDLGLLLQGPSGVGKSELALDLVSRGHQLVADDAVDVSRPAGGCLLGECPESLLGFIEVRGLGILDLQASYGEGAVAASARIDFAIRIDQSDPRSEPMDRLHGRRHSLDILGVSVPEILLPARLGHNAVMVEAACRDHWLRLQGYVASEAFVAAHDRRAAGNPTQGSR